MAQAAKMKKHVGEWRCITGRPLPEPPAFDYERMAADRIGPVEVREERSVDGWISDARLRRLFEKDMTMGYGWRDECTEYILAQNYMNWAREMSHCESDHERRQFFRILHDDLKHEDVELGNRGMEEIMALARRSGIVSNLGIWEFEHLDEDGGVKHIKATLEAEKDIFQIPTYGLFKVEIRSTLGQPFYRGVGSLPAAEKYVHLAPPKFQAYLRKRYRLSGWKEAVLDDPARVESIFEEEDHAGYWWWGEAIKGREKAIKKQETKGQPAEHYLLPHESDELAIVKPSFKALPEMKGWDQLYEEEDEVEDEDEDEKQARADGEAIEDALRYASLFGKHVMQIPSISMRIVNLISAREKIEQEDFLSKEHAMVAFQMFREREDLMLKYLNLKSTKNSDSKRQKQVVEAWITGRLVEYKADASKRIRAKGINKQATKASHDQTIAPAGYKRTPRKKSGWFEQTKEAAKSLTGF